MSDWKEYKLGEHIEVINGYAFKSTNFLDSFQENSLPVIKIKNVANGDVHLNDCHFHLFDKSLGKFIVDKNDILIALTGNHPETMTQVVGETSRYKHKEKALLNQRVAKVVAKSSINDDFLYYFLKEDSIHDYLASQSGGSANQANISKSDIENITILLPPLPEQTAIAETLSSLDNKIDLLHSQVKILEELAETIFRQKFIEDVTENWKVSCFSEHTEVLRGLSYKGDGLTDMNNGIPMHNLNSIYEGGGYKFEGIKYYKGVYKERHISKPGDLIIANTEQGHKLLLIGCPAIVPSYYGDLGIFSQHIYKLSLLPNTYLTTQYFYYLIKSPKVREQITGATNGSTVNMLAIDGLQLPEFQLPPKELILQFTALVKDIWDKKEKNYNHIQTLQKLRDTLLPKLMSGEIRIKM